VRSSQVEVPDSSMEKPFRPASLETLARWILPGLDRLASGGTVLGLPAGAIVRPDGRMTMNHMGLRLDAPLGMAAGPHTQLAQNIVAGWLCGARFMELKTVQILDRIEVSRPCIDAADETYNCEWSQELTLEESFTEYLNAWVLVHALAQKMAPKGAPTSGPGAVFNMSVGYNLEGIQSPSVQRFMRRMRDASEELPAAIEAVAKVHGGVRDIAIPSEISRHVTLSTMHGCPPSEIARIAKYMLGELGVNTWVKLNPTLLGPERLRGMLNERMGWDIVVPDAAFEHDPRFGDAMAMVAELRDFAHERGLHFGVKLSNTLEVDNRRPVFPPHERTMYLSGRALHPLTLTLAREVRDALDNTVPLSFCGGADAQNFAELVADGLGPVTTCTDLLKPGGYARLGQYLENLAREMTRVGATSLEAYVRAAGEAEPVESTAAAARRRLGLHAAAVLHDERVRKRERPLMTKGERSLGAFDCIAAPCQEGCPAHQNIPDYLHLVARGRPDEARDVILRTNSMPCTTGAVCDHPCADHCVRNHYDAPLAIREIKRFAFQGEGATIPPRAEDAIGVNVAIVGGGPAGLTAAWFLAQAGFGVTVFEARGEPGGMVDAVIPAYRLGHDDLARDITRMQALGVDVRLGARLGPAFGLAELHARGYACTFLAVGAQAGKTLGIPGEDAQGVWDALAFLRKVRNGEGATLGKRVLVVGGGNSAMDAARTARRLVPGGEVTLVYRRTRAEMPAEPDEIIACLEEGVTLRDLLAPIDVRVEAGRAVALVCQVMRLGEPDSSGRKRPVPVEGQTVVLPCDAVIPAIGQDAVIDFLGDVVIDRWRDGTIKIDPTTCETSVPGLFAGGDVARGPASVIKAIADGRTVASVIAARHGRSFGTEPDLDKDLTVSELLMKRARLQTRRSVPTLPVADRAGFEEVLGVYGTEAAMAEASRCLDCDELCSLCVTVCPNRAMNAYVVTPRTFGLPVLRREGDGLVQFDTRPFAVRQAVQVLNVADFCNACGNCVPFCPTAGSPWMDKPRLHLDADGFAEAEGDAFRIVREGQVTRIEARLGGLAHRLTQSRGVAVYDGQGVRVQFEMAGWRVVEAQVAGDVGEGAMVDLGVVGTLTVLLEAAEGLPVAGR